jgi:hypothetical protein
VLIVCSSRAGAILISRAVFDALRTARKPPSTGIAFTYEQRAEPLTLHGDCTPTTTYFLGTRMLRRRQQSTAIFQVVASDNKKERPIGLKPADEPTSKERSLRRRGSEIMGEIILRRRGSWSRETSESEAKADTRRRSEGDTDAGASRPHRTRTLSEEVRRLSSAREIIRRSTSWSQTETKADPQRRRSESDAEAGASRPHRTRTLSEEVRRLSSGALSTLEDYSIGRRRSSAAQLSRQKTL